MRSTPDQLLLRQLENVVAGITEHWLNSNRLGSPALIRTLCALSWFISLLDIRSLWCQGFSKRRKAARLSRGLDPEVAHAMARKGAAPDEKIGLTIFNFMVLQLRATFGFDYPHRQQFIYHLLSDNEDYVGRTMVVHKTGPQTG